MSNPFVINSATVNDGNKLFAITDMGLLEENQGNAAIFSHYDDDMHQLFVLDREMLDMQISYDGQGLYVLTHEILFYYDGFTTDAGSSAVLTSEDIGLMKKMCVATDAIYIITVSDQIIRYDIPQKSIDDISYDIDESGGLERLILDKGKLKYAVGWNGLIIERKNNTWVEIPSPTNKILSALVELEDGKLLVVGQTGILLYGDKDALQVIDHDWEGYDFWDVVVFKGRNLILAENGVFEFVNGKDVVPVVGREQIKSIFFSLRYSGNVLWAISERNIIEYDEKDWVDVITLSS